MVALKANTSFITNTVTSFFLGLIQQTINPFEKGTWFFFWPQLGQTATKGYPKFKVIYFVAIIGNHRMNAKADLEGLFQGRAGKQYGKFVTAYAVGQVKITQGIFDQLSKGQQNFVAHGMAPLVVDPLKIVKVYQ